MRFARDILLRARIAAALGFVFAQAGLLRAQTPVAVAGIVTDSSGAGITGAEVSLVGKDAKARTDEAGKFKLSVPPGLVTLSARRLGFLPETRQLQFKEGDIAAQVEIRLATVPTTLKPVVVRSNRMKYTGRLAGYYQRLEANNGGYFITREQIDRANPRNLTQLLTQAPAINDRRMRGGGTGVRMRGRQCSPLVWLDGLPMGAGEVDLDAFAPQTIQGIELYLGSTTAPMKYISNRDQSSCGTILIWSRGPDTDPPRRSLVTRVDLEKLVSSLRVYTPDQVDQPASVDVSSLAIDYPPSLYASGTGGSVIAEFIVDTSGHVEEGTFGIVSSTDPLLSDAVRKAIESASFQAAKLKGSTVRQVVQQPFSFGGRPKKKG
jgi:TonB family protein